MGYYLDKTWHRGSGLFILVSLLSFLSDLAQPVRAAQEKDPPTFAVEVNLVVLSVTVLNRLATNRSSGYRPLNEKHNGTYRVIGVTVTAPGHGKWSVHTRAGYFTPSLAPAGHQEHAVERL